MGRAEPAGRRWGSAYLIADVCAAGCPRRLGAWACRCSLDRLLAASFPRRLLSQGINMMDAHSGSALGDVLDAHLAAEFTTEDLDAAMATMAGDPYLIHVPVMTGGTGWDEVREFYGRIFIGHWPKDTAVQRVSRTVGAGQVVDELVMSFTHDVPMGALLPGVAPTGRFVRLPVCVVAAFEDGKLAHEHIYWDQASLLVQVGLLDPAGLPVTGAEQAENILAPRAMPANRLLGKDWATPA